VDTVRVSIPVARGEYRLEKLTVAPQFGTPPDSATAARIAREQAMARNVSIRSHATPRMWNDTVVRPRDTRITSGFGHGREFNGQVQSRHTGTDFAGTVGAPVYAAARGVVALVDSFFLAGNVIYLDHGEGLVTAYFHLSRQDVRQGDIVEAGQAIGRVGATGRVTGPHLHWVVRYGRITVDPLSFLALAGAEAR
jgi:murein DD-endopeptidase MepM/ murein hydrolase activator NlpD